MKKFFATFLALVLLCACSSASTTTRETTVTTVPGAADTALPQQVVFAVSSNSEKYISDAAENFCKKTNSLFKGGFTLTYAKSTNPLADFRTGKASIILLNGDNANELNPFFSACNEFFRYPSYEIFSMLLNSKEILEPLSEACDAKVYAAYYTGSNVLASRKPLDKLLALKRDKEGAVVVGKVDAFTRTNSKTRQVFVTAGIIAEDAAETLTRAQKLISANSVIELAYSEFKPDIFMNTQLEIHQAFANSVAEIKDEGEASSQPEIMDDTIIVTRTFHNITPMWLIISPQLFDSLTPTARAALEEAAACMTADIDGVVLALEEQQIRELEERGIPVSTSFSSARARLRRAQDSTLPTLTPQEQTFRNLLDKI